MKALLDLLRSMRFAVAILAVVAVASTIGSVLEQAQPAVVYVGAYGVFWADVFTLSGLTDVYHAWWFFLLLGVMAASTTLGLIQYTPQMLHEMRTFREHKSVASLRRMPHSAQLALPLLHGGGHGAAGAACADVAASLPARLGEWLRKGGYRYRQQALPDGSLMLAASTGMSRRAGYLLVHSAIVLICAGGLADGNLALRWQLLTGGKQIERRDLGTADVPARSRLTAGSGSFRGAMNLAEGDSGSGVLLSMGDGYLLRELPFAVRLKEFRVEHYEQKGMPGARPSDFVSEIEILDGAQRIPATLRVNHPFTYRGVTMYQSGFADGGSKVRMQLVQNGVARELEGKVGGNAALLLDGEPYTLELSEWRTNNVVNRDAGQGKALEDVGPSLTFRLRDKTGQASEWLVYRNPIRFDGVMYAVTGMRAAGKDEMRYARIPLDGDGRGAGAYDRLAAALATADARRAAALAAVAQGAGSGELARPTQALLEAFAARGYRGVAELVQRSVPAAEQLRAGELYSALIERALGAALARPGAVQATAEAPAPGPASARAAAPLASEGAPPVRALMDAYSDAIEKGMSLRFAITSVEQRNASVLQVAHAPGAWLVYLGCAMLAIGVCCMYFVRERRLWLVLDRANGTLLAAYAGNRDSPSLPKEFRQHQAALAALCKQP